MILLPNVEKYVFILHYYYFTKSGVDKIPSEWYILRFPTFSLRRFRVQADDTYTRKVYALI